MEGMFSFVHQSLRKKAGVERQEKITRKVLAFTSLHTFFSFPFFSCRIGAANQSKYEETFRPASGVDKNTYKDKKIHFEGFF